MKKLSTIPTPAVAGSVRAYNVRSAIAEIRNCFYDGADMIDLHISCLEDTSTGALKIIISSTPLPVLAMEAGKHNICVNCISPGAISRSGKNTSSRQMTFLGDKRIGTPQDIADTVLFLAYQDYITGENIVVDGGRTLGPGRD